MKPMPGPNATPNLEEMTGRPFSFYPAILNIEHNEWTYRQGNWSEVLVANTKSGQEIWVPRRYVGEVSHVDKPVMIVGLVRELEYNAGAVWPHEKRLIQMPKPVNEAPPAAEGAPASQPARKRVPIRRVSAQERRIGKLIGLVLGIGVLVCILLVLAFRGGPLRSRVVFTSKDQDFLDLNSRDDYYSVVRKLGPPAEDRWKSETGELQYRLLWYPARSYFVILMGTDRKELRYIGALDRNWHLVHYVELSNARDTASMLRTLPKF
jgi:hypothetical protein